MKHTTFTMQAVLVCIVGFLFGFTVLGWADDPNEPVYWSSPDPNARQPQQAASDANGLPITFSEDEYPLYTHIANQYAPLGIIFGGDDPYIVNDGDHSTSPVLSGTPLFEGVIEGYFHSSDPNGPATVYRCSFDAGYFDQTNSTLIEWFDLSGSKMGQRYNSTTGIEKIIIEGPGIASWRIGENSGDTYGFSIDNVDFETPVALDFDKYDDVNDLDCRQPQEDITYTIYYHNRSDTTFYDAYVVDYFPEGVDFPAGADSYVFDGNSIQSIEGDPGYDEPTQSYLWNVGDIYPNDANSIDLEVTVNNSAAPGMKLHNVAELWATVYDANGLDSGEAMIGYATEDTLVCCWGNEPNVIYVDQSATGYNIGISWDNAYTDLADALRRATDSNCIGPFTIYVAQGTYDPNETPELTFALPDGCKLYGGFKGGSTNPGERNPKQYETILTGDFDDDGFPNVDAIVTMGDECLLDGFTVTNSSTYAIYGSAIDFTVENCTIAKNEDYGIRAQDGNVTVRWCFIRNNGLDGIRHTGIGFDLVVDNSWIMRNQQHGIYCLSSTPTIKNSIISESDLAEEGREGISMINPSSSPILYNNTISNNLGAGVFFTDTGTPDLPDIQNCIIYYNNDGGLQLVGLVADDVAYYSCIQDCNEINNNHNYNNEPEFAYVIDPNGIPNPENYHLAANSFCIDKGNNVDLTYTGQVDIDGDGIDRMYGNAVDIGADEVNPDCNDVSHPLDWNADGLVNLHEYAKFSRAWLSHDPNEPGLSDPNLAINWNPICNLDDTENTDTEYVIDLADLKVLVEDDPVIWLWKACWRNIYEPLYDISGTGSGESMMMVIGEEALSGSNITVSIENIDLYADMSESELALFVKGIFEITEYVDSAIAEKHENAENLTELKDFLEGVLDDIQVSRQ